MTNDPTSSVVMQVFLEVSPSCACRGLYRVEESPLVKGARSGTTRRRLRPELQYEVRLIPSQEGVPAGDFHLYRHMDEMEREAILLDSLMRILRESAATESVQSASNQNSELP